MRGLLILLVLAEALAGSPGFSQKAELSEIKREIRKLEKLKEEVEKLIEEKRKLLAEIERQKKELEKEKQEIRKIIESAKAERYKKLARIFEKMDPELAGQKISSITNPKDSAFIIYNMKERKAGEVLNYVDPQVVNLIVKELTAIRLKALNNATDNQTNF